ncbi:hypothetical protein D5018_14815 [Parashewanella curva]|uniref:Uncharacterized protein n=1 Tax=Parashewanella curva TaxID=2338552 RepID=A0A3L8PU41_9GAMM|nr:hypothetical protein D5018_14815 [Parashewanella curva]
MQKQCSSIAIQKTGGQISSKGLHTRQYFNRFHSAKQTGKNDNSKGEYFSTRAFNNRLIQLRNRNSGVRLASKTQDLIKLIVKKKARPSQATCTILLSIYAKTNELDNAKHILFGRHRHKSHLDEWQLAANNKIYCAYLGVCAKTGNGKAAQQVLEIIKGNVRSRSPNKAILPDAITCVQLLTVYAETGEMDKAQRLLISAEGKESYLDEWQIPIDVIIYNTYLGVCAKTGNGKAAQQVLEIIKGNFRSQSSNKAILPNAITCVQFLTVYAETGEFDKAQRILFSADGKESYLDEWQIPANIIIYNAYLGVCAKTGNGKAAQQVLDRIKNNVRSCSPNRTIRPNAITCVQLLSVYTETGEMDKAQRLLFDTDGKESYLEEWQVPLNIKIFCAYLGVCAKTGNGKAAQQVLDIIKGNVRSGTPSKAILPNTITCVQFLKVYAETGEMDKAQRLLFDTDGKESYLEEWQVPLNSKIFCAYLGVCVKTGNGKAAQQVLDIIKGNVRSHPHSCNAVRPNEVTCVQFLSVYAETGEMNKALRLLFGIDGKESYLDEWHIPLSNKIFCAYLGVCAKTGSGRAAQQVLDIIKGNVRSLNSFCNAIRPNVITCVQLLSVYTETGEMNKAERLLFGIDGKESYLDEWHIPLSNKIFCAYLGVCAKTGNGKAAQQVLDIIKGNVRSRTPNKAILPSTITCVQLLAIYAKTGDFDKAQRLLFGTGDKESYLKEWQVPLNTKIFCAYLGVCAKTGNGKAAQQVLDIIKGNVRSHSSSFNAIRPNDVTCVQFLSVYAETGEMNKAQRILFGIDGKESYLDEWHIPLSNKIFCAYLGVCAKTGNGKAAQQVLDIIKGNVRSRSHNKAILPDAITCVQLLTVYAETGEMDKAQRLLISAEGKESYLDEWQIPIDVIIYNTYLGVCAKTGNGKAAQQVLEIIKGNFRSQSSNKAILPNAISCVQFLKVYAETGEMDKAQCLLFGANGKKSYQDEWEVIIDSIIYNAYLGVCAKTGNGKAAQQVLDIIKGNVRSRSPNKAILPDAITCVQLLSVYAETGEMDKAQRLLFGTDGKESYLDEWQIPISIIIYNAYLGVCAKTGNGKAAQQVLDIIKNNVRSRSPNKALLPNDVTCTQFLMVYAETGEFDKADCLVFGEERQKSYIDEWKIVCRSSIYSLWLVVNKNAFSKNIERIQALAICYENMGLTGSKLNLHVEQIFKNVLNEEKGRGVPFELAKALFLHHYQQDRNQIKAVVTGYRSGNTLKTKLTSFLSKELGFIVTDSEDNLGLLELKAAELKNSPS